MTSDDSDDSYQVRGGKNRRSSSAGSRKRRDRKKSKEKRRERRIFQHKTKELEEDEDSEDSLDSEDDDEDTNKKSRRRGKSDKGDKHGPITVQVTLPKGASRGLTIFLDFGSVMSMYPIPPMRYESNEVISIVVERPKGMKRRKPKITFAVPKSVKRTPKEFYD